MSYTPFRLAGPQALTTSEAGVGAAVASNTTVILRQITVTNTTSGALTFSLSLVPSGGTAGTANRLQEQFSVPAHDFVDWSGVQHVMVAGDFLSGLASGAGLNVTVSAWKIA